MGTGSILAVAWRFWISRLLALAHSPWGHTAGAMGLRSMAMLDNYAHVVRFGNLRFSLADPIPAVI